MAEKKKKKTLSPENGQHVQTMTFDPDLWDAVESEAAALGLKTTDWVRAACRKALGLPGALGR